MNAPSDAAGSRMRDRLLQGLVVLATLAMIAANGLAATGVLGGRNTAEVSAKYPTVITPPTYAFGIWGVIYLGLIAFSALQLLPSRRSAFAAIRVPYLWSCAANALWLWLWALEQLVLCQITITALWVALIRINGRLAPRGGIADGLLARAPFGLYCGWVTAAALLNLTILAVSLGASFLSDRSSAAAQAVGCAAMLLLGAAGAMLRPAVRNAVQPLGIAWAALAVALGAAKDRPGQPASLAIALGAAAACAFCVAVAVWSALRPHTKPHAT